MRRTVAALLVVSLVLAAVGPSVAVAAVPDARLTVSGLTVAPDRPVTGEPVTVTATVQNSAGSDSPVRVASVALYTADGARLDRARDIGSLSVGDSLGVDLVATFGEAGERPLYVEVVAEDADEDEVTVRRPLTVVVEASPPQLDVEFEEPVADVENRVSVTVSNPSTTVRRNMELTLSGERVGPADARATVPSLAAGASETVNLTVRPGAGEGSLTATLAYTTSTGARDTTELTRGFEAEPLREDVGVAVSRAPEEQQTGTSANANALTGLLGIAGAAGAAGAAGGGGDGGNTLQSAGGEGGSGDALAVEVTNFGNAPVADAVVVPRAGDRTLPRRFVGTLAPGESATVTVSLDGVEASTVEALVRYDVAGRNGSAVGAFDYRPPAGELRVTDVDLSVTDDGRLLVTGNAGNVGDGRVGGVVVAVGSNEHVSPAYPQRDYFVGTVEANEFAPFELTANVDAANASQVPVRLTYRTGGETVTENLTLPYDRSLTSERGGSGSASLLPFGVTGAAAGVTVGLALLVPAVYLVRRRTGR
ncbi:MAG: CARDB domain-containing protein [Haloarculaceae archaeon]